jgi:hypothetical protein
MTINELVTKSSRRATTTLIRVSRPFGRIWPRRAEAVVGMIALFVVLFAALTYIRPLAKWTSELVGGNKYLAMAEGMLNPFRSPRLLLDSGLPVYNLEIDHQQMGQIEDAIEQAKKQGYMSEELQVWANGRFYYEGQDYNVKVRVRGDLPPHWQGPKKSWRIKFGRMPVEHNGEVTDEQIYFEGKHQINLIIPIDRDYIVAPFANALMREAGLLVPEDKFVVLRINGVVQGLYYEVEQFDKPLMAAQERPETTIFGQSDRAMHFEQYTKYGTPIASDAKFDVGTVRLQVEEQGEIAMQALRSFQVLLDHANNPTPENFRRVRTVLDWEKYLRFRNLTTLFNTNHVRFGSDNFKLYFDPSRGLLEPIPWDVHLVRMPTEPGTIDFWNSKGPDEIQRATLLDPVARLERNRMLWEWVADGGDAFLEKYNKMHDEIRPLAWADVLNTPVHGYRMDELKSDLTFNVKRVHKVLSLSSADFSYLLEANDRATLEVASLNFSGIDLQDIRISDPAVFEGQYQLYQDLNDNGELDPADPLLAETGATNGTIHFDLNQYVLPELVYGGDTIDGRYWEYFDTMAGRARFFLIGRLAPDQRHPLEWTQPQIQVRASNAVTGEEMPSAYIDYSTTLPENAIGIVAYDASDPFDLDAQSLSLEEFLQANPQFLTSEAPGSVELGGDVTLSGTVIVPEAVHLLVQPGTDITMLPGASLVSYGGLTAVGTPDSRIAIHGDGSGTPWGTFAVIRPSDEVNMAYIDFQHGDQAQINGILLTGGFAVHDGDLRLEHCTFTNMRSEDGFNLKNGHIFMNDCLIADNASDGVDLDFVTGEVRDSHFLNNVGDGLDTSGTQLLVIDSRFENSGDKGFSVGEDSHPTIINGLFRGNQIGLSTKDLSHTQAAYVTFVDNVLAVEAKRKKPFFGGGSGEFVNSVFSGNQILLEDDYFSSGQVEFLNSVTDDSQACPACATGTIRYQSAETGDYRLLIETLAGSDFEIAPLDWEGLAGLGALPDVPGTSLGPAGGG